jgi:hypothetical protein
MEMLSIFYTGNLRGDEATLLKLLPRLFTFIQQGGGVIDAPTNSRVLCFDLGDSCAPDVWPCNTTGGRSTLLVLDAMGFTAANANFLAPEDRAKLVDIVQVTLVDEEHNWQSENICGTLRPTDMENTTLQVILQPAATTFMEGNRLHLAEVQRGQVGIVQVDVSSPFASVIQHTICDLPPGTHPDPTISGAAEFVLDEARYFQRKQT